MSRPVVRSPQGAILGVERWRPIVGYEGAYEVSDFGRVRSLDRTDRLGRHVAGVLMTPTSKGTAPHLKVELRGGPGGRVTRLVHRLVLEAFDGPCPDGHECRHLDGDPTNNWVKNLRWGTRSENNDDAVAHGTHFHARKTHCPRVHLLAEPNIVAAERRRGHRACLACSRAQSWAKYYPVAGDAGARRHLLRADRSSSVSAKPKRPMVYNEHGAPCGIDWRQVPGMGLVSVPGRVQARDVVPGDTVRLDGQDVVVHKVVGSRSAQVLHLVTKTSGGCEIVHEAIISEEIDVTAVGAFEPRVGS